MVSINTRGFLGQEKYIKIRKTLKKMEVNVSLQTKRSIRLLSNRHGAHTVNIIIHCLPIAPMSSIMLYNAIQNRGKNAMQEQVGLVHTNMLCQFLFPVSINKFCLICIGTLTVL